MTTPYRTDEQALRDKKAEIEGEMARIRADRGREEALAKELAAIEARLQPKRALPLLDQVKVATPCPAAWDDMVGDDRTRFCLACEKNVFNLSAMTRDEAESFLREKLGASVCVRFYRRADGTMMTSDCPVGVSRKRKKTLALAVAGAGAAIFAAATAMRSRCQTGKMTVGEMQPIPVEVNAPPPK